jgi:hypothetical protein
MNCIFLRNLALVAMLVFANPVAAQPSSSARSAATPAASSASGSRTRGTPTDPRASVEAVEAKLREISTEDLKLPPKRDYKIELGERQKVKLFRADPKLLENKFYAKLVLVRPEHLQQHNWLTGDPRNSDSFPKEMGELLSIVESGNYARNRASSPVGLSISNVFEVLAKHCPAEQLPEPALVAYLTSAECDRDIPGTSSQQSFTIFAPTAKEAEARAAAIIRLYDCGVFRPLQQYFYAEGQTHLLKARAGCDSFDKLSEEVRAEEEKLARPSEVSADILSQLKAQKIMVAVELAGLNARVKACDGMLSDPKKLEVSTMQSISDMKVKAEIERIGTKEKLDQIISFIAEGDKREAINDSIVKLNGRRARIASEVSNAANLADTYAYLAALYSPRPIKTNTVLILPVEWTEQ